jgi:hypothetical protein
MWQPGYPCRQLYSLSPKYLLCNITLGQLRRPSLKESCVPLRVDYRDQTTISSCLDLPYGKFYQAFICLAILEPIPNKTSLNVPSQGKGCSRL